jgi:peptidoglycan/LPS O-acetylase OafA/YrhL
MLEPRNSRTGVQIGSAAPSPTRKALPLFVLTFNTLAFAILVLWAFPRSWVKSKPLETVGRYSYSIYLWHMPLRNLFPPQPTCGRLSVFALSSIALGMIMASLVEFPALKLRQKLFPN